jgi:hypothetical protein
VTSESIGRDLNPLGRGDGSAYIAGTMNLGFISPDEPMPMSQLDDLGLIFISGNSISSLIELLRNSLSYRGQGTGNSINNAGCSGSTAMFDDSLLHKHMHEWDHQQPAKVSSNFSSGNSDKWVWCPAFVKGCCGRPLDPYKLNIKGGARCCNPCYGLWMDKAQTTCDCRIALAYSECKHSWCGKTTEANQCGDCTEGELEDIKQRINEKIARALAVYALDLFGITTACVACILYCQSTAVLPPAYAACWIWCLALYALAAAGLLIALYDRLAEICETAVYEVKTDCNIRSTRQACDCLPGCSKYGSICA